MIKLIINGQSIEIEGPMYLLAFLNSISVDVKFVAVARNGEIIDKEIFPEIVLNEGDNLEIVRPVGGG